MEIHCHFGVKKGNLTRTQGNTLPLRKIQLELYSRQTNKGALKKRYIIYAGAIQCTVIGWCMDVLYAHICNRGIPVFLPHNTVTALSKVLLYFRNCMLRSNGKTSTCYLILQNEVRLKLEFVLLVPWFFSTIFFIESGLVGTV